MVMAMSHADIHQRETDVIQINRIIGKYYFGSTAIRFVLVNKLLKIPQTDRYHCSTCTATTPIGETHPEVRAAAIHLLFMAMN